MLAQLPFFCKKVEKGDFLNILKKQNFEGEMFT
jgi:hypothetical protein